MKNLEAKNNERGANLEAKNNKELTALPLPF